MMYKRLIDKLRTESLYKDKATLEIMDLCMEAADAIQYLLEGADEVNGALQEKIAENERMNAELERLKNCRHECNIVCLLDEYNEKCAELERVTRERDAAVGDLISREAAKKTIGALNAGHTMNAKEQAVIGAVMSMLDRVSTVDAAPVARGKWQLKMVGTDEQYKSYSCPVCGFGLPLNPTHLPKYCEECGADMRGEDNG